MTTIEQNGYPVTASDPAAVERYDRALDALLRWSADLARLWDATVDDDPDFAMGQIGRAFLSCLSSEGRDAAEARTILHQLGEGRHLHDRERRHLDAAKAYAHGDLHGARERLARLSVEYPRDALALVVGHQLDFFCGDAVTLRDRIGRAVLAWDEADERFGFLLGMQAFGLEESGLYAAAESAGQRAVEREPDDVWGVHAVVHVYEMQGRFLRGLRFLDERRGHWQEGNFLAVHNNWHNALFLLEQGDVPAALAIYDRAIHNAASEKVALEMLDASALLWRLHLERIDVGDRWPALADAWAERLDEPWYVFNDVHAVMAFAGAGRLDDARAVVERLAAYAASSHGGEPVANRAMTAEVGLPVCRAIAAFADGRYDEVIELVHPIRMALHRFGGSHAQRDAIARTLLEAAIRAGDRPLSAALVSERLAVNESSPYTWRQLARIRRDAGDEAGAAKATARERELQAAAVE